MSKRFVSIGFTHLTTDWLSIRKPELKKLPFVFAIPVHGKMIVTAANQLANKEGIKKGMPAADAKAIVPSLQVFDEKPEQSAKLLRALAEWSIRFAPIVSIDLPDGLILDCSGCTHLWGGEHVYLNEIIFRLEQKGYTVCAAMADTIGTAWGVSRFGINNSVIEPGDQVNSLLHLPASALRLDPVILDRLQKLGLIQIKSFISMPRSVLRRRFGEDLLLKLGQAMGLEQEPIVPILVIPPYQVRLPCLEPICTATGIEIAIKRLLELLCRRLEDEGKGLRTAILKGYRVDGKIIQAEIGTSKATYSISHLFKLFELKISTLEPALGVELFTLDAPKVEDVSSFQEALWAGKPGLDGSDIAELMDKIAGKVGFDTIHRYLPDEHHWPERSIKFANSLQEKPITTWRTDRPRPLQLLLKPEPIEVTAPIPDYPPILFRYKGKVHPIKKADGPERIEREWWIEEGKHRDYYYVEDEEGQRYWLFRSGHYTGDAFQHWFLHGFFS